ncbi:MAG: baseplate J/gp47 family protein [candidate division Zixibacteria bacterium]|nr:baseplate J/gp47 family protein [candidate division Zixibacteria bacterium]
MAEITDTGFVVKTQNEYFDDEKQLYLDIDPKWNLDPSTPDGLKIASDAEILGNLDETAERAYNSKDPNKSSGLELDVLSAITGTVRSPGTPSTVTLRLTGVVGTVIIAGKLSESPIDRTQWATSINATIGSGGFVDVMATCTIFGAIQANVNTITSIVDTVGGWQSVTNTVTATSGSYVQNDPSLRLERNSAVSKPGNNQTDSLIGELFAVVGVRRVRVYENFTGSVDANGLPAHSIAPIIDGGTDADVALAIFRKKNPGCALHAAGTSVVVPDVYDLYPFNTKTITFSRPIAVDIITVVTIQNDGSLPSGAGDEVKQAILHYVNGSLFDDVGFGFNQVGFGVGENVKFSRMFTPVNSVIGSYGNSDVSGITLNGSMINVVIAVNELSRWTEANITVVVV